MPRPATGTIVARPNAAGTTNYLIRFQANGKRRMVALGAVTRVEAEARLRQELADVERGIWRPASRETPAQIDMPTFHNYADQWWVLHEGR